MKSPGVYMIRNLLTGKLYVGSSQNMENRLKKHVRLLRGGKHHSFKLQRDFNTLGMQGFEFKPLMVCSVGDLLFFEQRAIRGMDAVAQGYNVAEEAGAPMRGQKHTEASKKKMSAAGLGKKKPEGHGAAVSHAKTGVPLSPEHCANITKAWETRRLTPVSAETRKKLSEAGMGRGVSEKSRQATIARNRAKKGIPTGPMNLPPEEHQRRINVNKARAGQPIREEIATDVRAAKRAAWAERKAKGLHTRRWYTNRGIAPPEETTTSKYNHDGGSAPTSPSEE